MAFEGGQGLDTGPVFVVKDIQAALRDFAEMSLYCFAGTATVIVMHFVLKFW